MTVARFDTGRLDKAELTDQGYLKAEAYATRTGVFYYINADGSVRRELRHPDDVFDPESLKTLRGVVLTNDHPPEPLSVSNSDRYQIGFTSDQVEKEGDFVKTAITVTKEPAVEMILKGDKQELSCGYFCDLEEGRGVFNGEEFDFRQRNIRYNHLSVVKRGRAGSKVRVKFDCLESSFRADVAYMIENEDLETKNTSHADEKKLPLEGNQKKGSYMVKFTVDGIEYEVQDGALAQAVQKLDESKKELSTKLEETEKEIETLKAKNDALDSELKKSDEKVKALESSQLSEKDILARADSLLKVRDFAKQALGKDFNADASVFEMKKAVVKKEIEGVNLDEKGESYVEVAFDVIFNRSSKKEDSQGTKTLANAVANNDKCGDKVKMSADEVRKKRMEEDKNAWKQVGEKVAK